MEVRSQPQQRRSREKHDRVLASAAELLREVPFDQIGTKLIADRAGVSIGSLYRFFPDRESIFDTLMTTWLDRHVALAEEQTADLPPTAGEFLDRLVMAFAAFWRTEPGYRQAALGHTMPVESAVSRHNDEQIVDRVARVLTGHYGVPETPALRPRLLLAVNVAEFLLQKAFRADPDGDPHVLAELRLLLRRYVDVNGSSPER
ncbi:MAG TPA: TetR/AcrR family transcriptional regulator [Actinoplanes sp.]|nr:TetR/AcrR family transcriptional regulator [Actinoplanes sp.]